MFADRDWFFYMDRMTSNELSAITSHQTFCLPKPLPLDGNILSNFAHIATSGRNFHDLQRPEPQFKSIDPSTKNDKGISAGGRSHLSHPNTDVADSSTQPFLSANGGSYPMSSPDQDVPKLPKKSITRPVTEGWFSLSSATLPNRRQSIGRSESANLLQPALKNHYLGPEPLSPTSAAASPSRHLSEPTSKVTSHSPVAPADPGELYEDHRPRSCRTSPSVLSPKAARKISQILTGTVTAAAAPTSTSSAAAASPHSLPTPKSRNDAGAVTFSRGEDYSANNSGGSGGGDSTSKSNAVAAMAAAAELMMKPSLASLMSTASPPMLVQSSLRDLVLKTAATTNSLPSLSTRDVSEEGSPNQNQQQQQQQQLYLLVPSNYPVIMPCPSQLIPLSSHLSSTFDETGGIASLQDAGFQNAGELSHNSAVSGDSFERAVLGGGKAKASGSTSPSLSSSSPSNPLPGVAFYGTEARQQRHSLAGNGGTTTTTGQVLSNWTQTLKRKCSSTVVSPRTAQLLGCATLSDVVHLSQRASTSPATSHDTTDSDLRSELITLSRSPPLSVSYRLSTDGDAASTTAALSPSASPPVITSHNFANCGLGAGGNGSIHGMAALRFTPTSASSAPAATTRKLGNLLGVSPATTSSASVAGIDDSDAFLCAASASRIREVLSPTAPAQPRSAMPALSDVKIPPPEVCHSNSTSDSLLSVDSSKNSVFFPSESSPNRNYINRIGGDSKDIRRRVSHNEVERRRRDRINTWISELHKLLPPEHQAKSQYQSKGVILKRVFEYFQNVAQILASKSSTIEKLSKENQVLEQELRQLKRENQILRASLNVHFSELPNQSSSSASSSSSALALSVLTPTAAGGAAGNSARLTAAAVPPTAAVFSKDALHSRICSSSAGGDIKEDSVLSAAAAVCPRQSPKRLSTANGGSGLPHSSSTPVELPSSSASPSGDSSPPPYKRALLFPPRSANSPAAGNPASSSAITDVTRPCM